MKNAIFTFIILFNLTVAKSQNSSISSDDSIKLIEKPYLLLERHLRGISDHNSLTVFCGIDLNFVSTNLSWYLQDNMRLSLDKSNFVANKISEKYVPKVSSGNEYLNVSYYIKLTDKRPYIKTDDGKCRTITKCEIYGTADLVINLFLNYWPQKIKLGGYKQGEIANFQLLGDRVSLYGINSNLYKIIISEDNIHFDYYKTFHIN